jgi:hypothetical protein
LDEKHKTKSTRKDTRRERKKKKKKEKKKKKKTTASSCLLEREQRERRKDEWGREICGGLVVNDDDICFQHILPRLNGTDLKFLYEVNSETRKLVRRSSRAGDLKKGF